MSVRHERKQVVSAEFRELDLGDPRRSARGSLIAERIAHRPGESLPEALLDDAEVEGAYRHLSSDHVWLDQIIAPHVENTRARVREAGVAYVAHDTTEFIFGGESKREGLGPVQGGDQGFLAQISLSMSADGERLPYGLLAIGTRVRPQ